MNSVLLAGVATTGTWLITALGAATVIFFRNMKARTENFLLGFSAGVMIAASFWSLLQPAIEEADQLCRLPACLVAGIGFGGGAAFLWLCDRVSSRFFEKRENTGSISRIFLLVLSITLHNIPEGLAVGVAFGAAGASGNRSDLFAAFSVALGIGLQNFPEGAAVSLPLYREGFSAGRSFFIGQASALVEPIFGLIGAGVVVHCRFILPYALAFAAGAMILVAVHELIPECKSEPDAHPYRSTLGILFGFALMMILDVAFG